MYKKHLKQHLVNALRALDTVIAIAISNSSSRSSNIRIDKTEPKSFTLALFLVEKCVEHLVELWHRLV